MKRKIFIFLKKYLYILFIYIYILLCIITLLYILSGLLSHYLPGCSWPAWWTDGCVSDISFSSLLESVYLIFPSYPETEK